MEGEEGRGIRSGEVSSRMRASHWMEMEMLGGRWYGEVEAEARGGGKLVPVKEDSAMTGGPATSTSAPGRASP